ncbi:MAG: hypothetical protein R3E52_16740 [Burkholderiaceae bacterium]
MQDKNTMPHCLRTAAAASLRAAPAWAATFTVISTIDPADASTNTPAMGRDARMLIRLDGRNAGTNATGRAPLSARVSAAGWRRRQSRA